MGRGGPRRRLAAKIVASLVCVVFVATACTGSELDSSAQPAAEPDPTSTPIAVPSPAPTSIPVAAPTAPAALVTPGAVVPVPTPEPTAVVAEEDRRQAADIAAAPLGTFVVARSGAGVPVVLPPWRDGEPLYEVPVYDEPFGEPRTLLMVNDVDDVTHRLPLAYSTRADAAPLVLRVIAGGPDDEWLQVQAPVRPHNRSVWVRASDFEFGFTANRIEINLAGKGRLRLIEGGAITVDTPIVQGREGRETPTHLTYLMGGAKTPPAREVYGTARLELASFSEKLGTFGGPDGIPWNYLHGTNNPELMGERVSSGEIRVPNEIIDRIVARTAPGTPVILFDADRDPLDLVVNREHTPAETVSFGMAEGPAVSRALERATPQIWTSCAGSRTPICSVGDRAVDRTLPVGSVFATAKPDVGQHVEGIGNLVPVYDDPGGEPRMLVEQNLVDNVASQFPLYNPTVFGEPLVLRVLQGAPGDEWLRVQAPIRPHRHAVWVRADDFVIAQTLVRIEVDLAGEGSMTLFRGDQELMSSPIVSGRDSRPTTLHDTYVEQVVEGKRLSPAYGTFILPMASYSEVLGTYGGGAPPGQSLHGTNQPELMGRRVSSGGIRVSDDVIADLADESDIVGASVVLFDSTDIGRLEAMERQIYKAWQRASTTTFGGSDLPVITFVSYS